MRRLLPSLLIVFCTIFNSTSHPSDLELNIWGIKSSATERYSINKNSRGTHATVKRQTSSCRDNFCTEVPNYPYQRIRAAISNIPEGAFGNIIGEELNFANKNRPDEDEDEKLLCKSTLYVVYPKTGVNINNVTKFIINTDEEKQGVTYRKCVSNDNQNTGKCGLLSYFPENLTGECVQKYSQIMLISFDNDKNKAAYEKFNIPSCCVCSVTRINKN